MKGDGVSGRIFMCAGINIYISEFQDICIIEIGKKELVNALCKMCKNIPYFLHVYILTAKSAKVQKYFFQNEKWVPKKLNFKLILFVDTVLTKISYMQITLRIMSFLHLFSRFFAYNFLRMFLKPILITNRVLRTKILGQLAFFLTFSSERNNLKH
jgi:hypothetical protein